MATTEPTFHRNLQEKKTAVIKCYCAPGNKRYFEQIYGRGISRRIEQLLLVDAPKFKRMYLRQGP